jgi:hypothetical protein
MPAPWASSAPWLLVVVTIIVIVIGMRPDPATVWSCLLVLTGAAKAYRKFSR